MGDSYHSYGNSLVRGARPDHSIESRTVVLPREVSLALRGGVLVRDLAPQPPELEHVDRGPDLVYRTAGQQAFQSVRLVEDLLEAWSTAPPSATAPRT